MNPTPHRIIFSRKGFDSANGGFPSPIFDTGRMLSLPIPAAEGVEYKKIDSGIPGFNSVEDIVKLLAPKVIQQGKLAHLDPDLNVHSVVRGEGWRGIYGQGGPAQTLLNNQDVTSGDLFLFFGTFRRVTGDALALNYVGLPLHVLFGWLRIEHRYLQPRISEVPTWAAYHPHLQCPEGGTNAIYTASAKLDSETDLPEWGVFQEYNAELSLTHPAQNGRRSHTLWRLPCWMDAREGRTPLTYHKKECFSNRTDEHVTFQSARHPGQEFVLRADEYPEAWPWAQALINTHGGN